MHMEKKAAEEVAEEVQLVIWGAGALGSRVGAGWAGPVHGFTRTTARHAALRAAGIEPVVGDPLDLLAGGEAARVCLLLSLPGHEAQGAAIARLQHHPPPVRAVLISTTGYYGSQGGRLNEETPVGDETRARSIAQVEEAFAVWAGEKGVILRMGGLYDDQRGPYAALRRRGTTRSPIVPNKVLPLIHYDDAASAVGAALRRATVAPCYLTVTPPCPTRAEFYAEACRRLNLPLPPQAPAQDAPPAIYDVALLRRDLLPEPAYPDWRAIF
jgi:nucleoside-diphosphate-sugar epimerase